MLLAAMGLERYPDGFADEVADHVVAFTLGGLAALERTRARTRRGAARRKR